MVRSRSIVLLVAAALPGCKAKPSHFDGPMPVTFGDCAGPTIAWVSGPRPQPFTPAEAEALGHATAEPQRSTGAGATAEPTGGFGGELPATSGIPHRGPAAPTVSVGQPSSVGDLDKAIIRRYIKRNLQKIIACYEQELLADARLAGTIVVQFYIAPTGRVAAASATGVSPTLTACVAEVIKRIEFPKPKGGGGVQVVYPLTFRAAGDVDPKSPDPDDPADASGGKAIAAEASSDGIAAGSGGTPAGSGAPQVTAAPVRPGRPLFRAADRSPADASRYEAGGNTPLRIEEFALTECFRNGRQHFGAAVIELHYDAIGKISEATAHVIEEDDVRACVAAVAKRIPHSDGDPAALRCSLAFGVMPTAEMPAIDITADAIKLGDKPIARMTVTIAGEPPHAKLPSLVAAVAARVTTDTATTGPALVLHEPWMIRPISTTPMGTVLRVLASVLAAGDDFVLTAQRGGEWRPFQSMMTLPVVPVPFGTGGMWNHVKGQRRAIATEDERVVLSLLVTRQKIWIGMSRVDEFQAIAAGPSQQDQLAKALRAHKASAFFADRVDYEIAAEGDVAYADVVSAIDTAATAGFLDWQLTDPEGLAAPGQIAR